MEKEKIADFPMMNVSWDETGERLYFMNADEIRDSGDSPVYVYNGESVSEVSPGLRAECFGFIYEDAELTGEIGYLTEEEIWNGTYHILDLSDGRIRQEQLDEYVPYEQEDTRIISEGGDPEIVRHLKDNELCVSFGGDTVSLGPARYFDTIGDHILYIPEEAQSDGWTMVSSSFLRADRMELKAYNYETGEIKTVSNDIAGISINSELLGDGVVYMTPQSQLKLVTEPVEKSETVYPNKGLHRYGKPVTIMRLSRVSWQKPYLYKVDSDGNVTQLTDCHTEKWLYVPNGSREAEFSA